MLRIQYHSINSNFYERARKSIATEIRINVENKWKRKKDMNSSVRVIASVYVALRITVALEASKLLPFARFICSQIVFVNHYCFMLLFRQNQRIPN